MSTREPTRKPRTGGFCYGEFRAKHSELLRRTIRFFSREPSKHELLSHICHSWSTHREDREEAANPNTEMKLFFDEEEESFRSELQSQSQGQILTQDVAADLDSSPAPSRKRSYSEESINGALARRKLYK